MPVSRSSSTVLCEKDFRNYGTVTLNNGNNSVAGLTIRRYGANWITSELNSNGLQMKDSTGTGRIYIRLSDIHPNWNDFSRLRLWLYWDHVALGNNWEYLIACLGPVTDAGVASGDNVVHGNQDGNKVVHQLNGNATYSSTDAGIFNHRIWALEFDTSFLHESLCTAAGSETWPSRSNMSWIGRLQGTVNDIANRSIFFTSNNRDWYVKKLKLEGIS